MQLTAARMAGVWSHPLLRGGTEHISRGEMTRAQMLAQQLGRAFSYTGRTQQDQTQRRLYRCWLGAFKRKPLQSCSLVFQLN
jgi:hypothetical protein